MTRHEIYKFYDNKIDDIKDDSIYEKLMKKLDEAYDLLFDIDVEVEAELERQENEEPQDFFYDEEEEKEKYYSYKGC